MVHCLPEDLEHQEEAQTILLIVLEGKKELGCLRLCLMGFDVGLGWFWVALVDGMR